VHLATFQFFLKAQRAFIDALISFTFIENLGALLHNDTFNAEGCILYYVRGEVLHYDVGSTFFLLMLDEVLFALAFELVSILRVGSDYFGGYNTNHNSIYLIG
jgi:hypothetical protein